MRSFFHENKLYLRRYFNFEQELLNFISTKNSSVNDSSLKVFDAIEIKSCLDALFPLQNTKQENDEIDWQKVAVANAMNKNFSIIAGGPGTGKTYTVTKLLAALVMLNSSSKDNNQDKLFTAFRNLVMFYYLLKKNLFTLTSSAYYLKVINKTEIILSP